MAAAFTIFWIGWLRSRRFAYLMLMLWSITSLAGLAISYLPTWWVVFSRQAIPHLTYQFMNWTSFGRVIVTSIFLLSGLVLLVLKEPRASSNRAS